MRQTAWRALLWNVMGRLLGVVLLTMLSFNAHAAPRSLELPKALEEWQSWVLHKHDYIYCPIYHNKREYECLWVPSTQLVIEEKQLKFTVNAEVFAPRWLTLPGNSEFWPVEVSQAGKELPLREFEGRPQVYLDSGHYRIQGYIPWDKIPSNFPMPNISGVVSVQMGSQTITNPEIDNAGQLWLRKSTSENKAQEQDSQKIQVFRLLRDDNPATLVTRVVLDISGAPREIVTGEILLQDFVPLALKSALPARIEDNKNLRVQVKPGRWEIELTARHIGPLNSLAYHATSELWPSSELWAFVANRALRTVQIEGAPSVDPRQTNLPPEWAEYPAFRVQEGTELNLYEVHRGDPNPEADALELSRDIFLDFDGGGFTVSDHIRGQVNESWRLDTYGEYQLGSASLNGQPQLITTTPDGSAKGLEIRQGMIDLHAAGRYPAVNTMSISGWQQEFDKVGAQVYLPPGWSLFATQGIDRVNHSWISRWSLWDIFLVLVVVVAIYRLCGWQASALACATLLLLYHRDQAPIAIWLNIVGVIALLSVTEGRLYAWVRRYQFLSFAALALILLPFSVDQIREALYPQLEKPHTSMDYALTKPELQTIEAEDIGQIAEDAAREREDFAPSPELKSSYDRYGSASRGKGKPFSVQQEFDPNAVVQTGPGLPRWRWKQASLNWGGPVAQGETMTFYFVPPWLNRIGNLLAVLASILLAVVLFQRSALIKSFFIVSQNWMRMTSPAVVLIFMAGLVFSYAPKVHAAENSSGMDISEKLLEQLQERLLEAPQCLPQCASIASTEIKVNENILTVAMTVDANAHLAFALPAWQQHWLPDSIFILRGKQKKTATVKMNDSGQLFIRLSQGRHHIVLEGKAHGERVELPFSLPVHNINVESEGWTVSGIKDGLAKAGSVQLSRVEKQKEQRDALLPDPAPPFVSVQRKIVLGLEWNVVTTVTRIAPEQGALSVKIPLLEGESPITDVNLNQNIVTVDFPPDQNVVSWQSILQKQDTITLKAAENLQYAEVWILDVSPIWHVKYEGIAPIKQNNSLHSPVWQPWTGEEVKIHVVRPAAVEGKSLTIDAVDVLHDLGARSNTTVVSFNVRTSRGQDFPFNLPENAVFESLLINGQPQPLRQLSNKIEIPLSPGEQDIQLKWRNDQGVGLLSTLPPLNFEEEITNVHLKIKLPYERWPLFVGGPLLGPAVLLWGILIVVAVVAFILSRFALTPLRFHDWLLLGVGVVSTNVVTPVIIAAWFFVLGWRGRYLPEMTMRKFHIIQSALLVFSVIALMVLLATIPAGLLSSPDMHIAGNNSSTYFLQWYQDGTDGEVPQAWVFSFPIYIYRLAMLCWSLWLAVVLLKWLKWAWVQLNSKGFWQYENAIVKASHKTIEPEEKGADE